MKIVFMGTPEFSVPILNALANTYDVSLVISQPNRVKKKGIFIDTPVAAEAKNLGIKLLQPESIIDCLEEIKNTNSDVLVTAAYGQYLPSKILNLFKFKLNVHASLLPKHRGGAPIQRCLINGDEYTGVSIMEMVKKLDAGKVYAMEKYKILDEDNSTSLFAKLSIIGRDLLLNNIVDIYNGKNNGISQDDSLATYSPNISSEEELIDLNDTSDRVINKIRGLAMEPGAYLAINGIKIKVFKASKVDINSNEVSGTVLSIKKGIILKTLDGAISLDLVLYPGKKIISGRDFANGQKIFKVKDII